MIDRSGQLARARSLVAKLMHTGFFGEVTFKLEHGNIVYVELVENMRLTTEEAMDLAEKQVAKDAVVRVRRAPRGGQEGVLLTTVESHGPLDQVCDTYESPKS